MPCLLSKLHSAKAGVGCRRAVHAHTQTQHTLQGEASRRRRFSDWCRLDSRLLTTVVNGTIGKCQYTVSVAFAVLVLACVDGSIGIDLVAKA